MKKILILAQTPPPYHGQAIMQEYLVNVKWDWCTKKHIRLQYSDEINEVGVFKINKLWKLFSVILRVWKESLKGKIDVLYYPPTTNSRIPFYRDLITLFLIRPFIKKLIFHFHSGNFDKILDRLLKIEKIIAQLAYGNVTNAITLLPSLCNEVKWIQPKNISVVPNGIPDRYDEIKKNEIKKNDLLILFVGNLIEEKGILDCLEAAKILINSGYNIKFEFLGDWDSKNTMDKVFKIISEYKISEYVLFPGVKINDEKWIEYYKADIFCFPSYYPMENQPLVILEAMMMSLPVISTKWRAIPDLVEDGKNGFLIPIKNSKLLAKKIEVLVNNPELRLEMGCRGREKYINLYTIEKHLSSLEEIFAKI